MANNRGPHTTFNAFLINMHLLFIKVQENLAAITKVIGKK